MEIRTMTSADLTAAGDIDATVESSHYLHIQHQSEGLAASWKLESRPLREKRIHRNTLSDETAFAMKQIAEGIEEGAALVAEHDGLVVASAIARVDETAKILRLMDLRVDFDYRRQGLASALVFQLIQEARNRGFRAVTAEALSDNFPALEFLRKLSFESVGFDTHANSNHDLVKDSVVLFWCLPLN
jgi:ribosomal protein S18 acetylase RimI-like enzyme